MKKVLPKNPHSKPKGRIMIDLIASVVIVVTIISLSLAVNMTSSQDNKTTNVGNFAIYKGNEKRQAAALMFNVYEGKEVVMEILSILRNYAVKATFFIGGIWAENNGDILRKIVESGSELGCHGYLHKDHAKLSLEQNKEEIVKTNRLIREYTGKTVTLFAPPSGSYGRNTESACRALGQKMILWTKDTVDWRDSDVSLLIKRATKNMSAGDLILMHPKPQTLTALPSIIEAYLAKGFSLLTVSEMIPT